MAQKHKTDSETIIGWTSFGVTLLIVGILSNLISPRVKDAFVLWFYLGVFIWFGLTLLFGFLDRDTKKQTKEPIATNKNNDDRVINHDNISRSAYEKIRQGYTHEVKEKLFDEYVDKEINRLIKENNISDYKDKQAARMIAINTAEHSPKVMSEIWGFTTEMAKEVEEQISIKEEKKVANHTAYEGRISNKDKNKLKSVLGYRCKACGIDMSVIYGDIGQNYIELHHKIPYSDIKENETRTLTDKEFCVLCPNCHRMIHKLPDASDIDLLSRIIKLNKKA